MERYSELDEHTIALFEAQIAKLAFPMRINFRLMGDSKQKKLIVIKKVSPVVEFLTKHQIFVFINEALLDLLDADHSIVEILLSEELNNINTNLENGTIKIGKHNLNTSTSVIDKFGLEQVKRAKDLERLTQQQSDEKAKDAEQAVDTQAF